MTNIISFTISLDNVKVEKRRHAVRHAISWINGLDYNEKYRKYTCSNIFRLMYFDDDGNSLVEPFSAYVVMGSSWATVYIEAENPTNIYNLFLFYWRTLNKRQITSCKPCFIAPENVSFKVGEQRA